MRRHRSYIETNKRIKSHIEPVTHVVGVTFNGITIPIVSPVLGTNGLPNMRRIAYQTSTLRLDPECPRAKYRALYG